MKILFLDQFSEMGGAQRGLLQILDAVAGRGWGAHVLIPPGGPLVKQLRSRDLGVHEIPCGPYRSGTKSAPDLVRFALDVCRQTRIIGDLMRRIGFDLIYVNGPRLLPAAALATRGRVPVLFHAHSHITQKLAAWLAGWSIRGAGASVVACSHSVAEPLHRYVRSGELHIIPNGTRELGFRERTFDKWRIGMIGRISREKGQAEFLGAVALLRREFPNARFVICGAPILPAGNYLETVQELARGLPVEFLGWREDIESVLAGLDLLAVPSKQEGMGRVVVEAFSAGVPVVAFAVGGIPEVVTDQETGFLVKEVSSEALAASIREIITSEPARLRRVAANARRAWERYYTLAAYQNNITDLMERLASQDRAEREKAAPQPRR